MALIYFAVTLFVSAFLLFLVQPMIGKMILPRLGGTPQVWNTCMMFFQITLLAGYAYTHNVTSRLPVKKQLLLHCIVLLLPLPVLLAFGRPFYVVGFGAEGGGNPIYVTLILLTVIVGLPFLVVSTTAPLLQRWFHNTGHPAAADPYFLYGASNLGSILGLVLYPVFIEYFLGLNEQAWFWLCGYIVLLVMCMFCAFIVLRAPPTVQLPGLAGDAAALEPPPTEIPAAAAPVPAPEPATTAVTAAPPVPVSRATGIRRGSKQRGRAGRGGPATPAATSKPASTINIKRSTPEPIEEEKPYEVTPLRRLRWVGLAAVPTSLMLGTTTYISTDISPIPLLWIIPLTLYLLSFVLVFSRWPVPWVGVGRNPHGMTPHKVMIIAQMIFIPVLIIAIMTGFYIPDIENTILRWFVFCMVYYGPFFVTALVCHGELARDRPPAKFLTEFYLWIAVGGAVGGVFNAMIAPLVPWWGLFEFPLALVFAALVRPPGVGNSWSDLLFEGMPKDQRFVLSALLDVAFGVLLFAFSWWLIYNMSSQEGWFGWRVTGYRTAEAFDKNNFLFRVLHKWFGMSVNSAYSGTTWLSLLITFGLPIGLALLTWKRPHRMAWCFGAVLLGNALYAVSADERTLTRDRSYFGILRVVEDVDWFDAERRNKAYAATTLMHGSTHHGLNYYYPDGTKETPDMRRLATTYYHRDCPVGIVMEKLNWFPGYKVEAKDSKDKDADKRMTYWADARLPVSLIGSGAPGLGVNLPLPQLVSVWSEPAYATIGLGTGTMSSYARPFQHMTFYEIDEHIRDFSLPPNGQRTYFTYLQGALKRGTKLEIIMGDARLTMTKERPMENGTYYLPSFKGVADKTTNLEWNTFTSYAPRESYYRAIEVDAFSSDAIPVHLITKEAIELYMDKLTPNGVLCVHTSNRHVNLVQPVMNICNVAKWRDWTDLDENGKPREKTGLKWVVAKDEGGDERGRGISWTSPAENGHFSSEYILVARKQEYLPPYTLTKEEMANYKKIGAMATTFTYQQEELYKSEGVKILPKPPTRAENKNVLFNSTVDFYGPNSYDDPKVNYTFTLRNGRTTTVMDYHGYLVPPGARVWTDDYSNVLSVFRWSR